MNTREIRHFRHGLRRFQRLTHSQLKTCCCGVTLPQCLVLLEIDERGRLAMGQLSAQLRLDTSTLSRTIDSLVGKGLVERLRDDDDRRVVRIQLTADGNAMCRSIHKENDAHCRRVFRRIPASKREAVTQSFETLVQAFLDCEVEASSDTCCDPAVSDPPKPALRRSANGARKR
jgi:DNA-binding MarR family transcriptional regulator